MSNSERFEINPATSAAHTKNRIVKLIDECQEFSWASAWLGQSDVLDQALASKKIRNFILGTHGYHTDPEALEKCLNYNGDCIRAMPPAGKLFHPKIYFFDLGKDVEIYLGSSNMTQGGLCKNIECGVFLRGGKNISELLKFREQIETLFKNADTLDAEFVREYRVNHNNPKVTDAKLALKSITRIKKPKELAGNIKLIDPQEMNWRDLVKAVAAENKQSTKKRLEVLSNSRALFKNYVKLSKMPDSDGRLIAGLVHKDIDGQWGFFGTMKASRSYSKIYGDHLPKISKALDKIPFEGDVTQKDYENFVAAFTMVPGISTGYIAIGTRLLCMKRPDYFVCLNDANKKSLCGAFGEAFSTTNLENYWERIIAPMMCTPWWNSKKPSKESSNNREDEIWMGRAAMLDAIYYEPSSD